MVSACLANQGGLNLVASYEAFCVKMLGAVRQTLIFARQQKGKSASGRLAGLAAGRLLRIPGRTAEPAVRQDTTFCEALLGEMTDMVRCSSRPITTAPWRCYRLIYRSRGQLACLPGDPQARPADGVRRRPGRERLARDGAILVEERCGSIRCC